MTLTCSANGYPVPTYTIKRNDVTLIGGQGKHVITNIQLGEEDVTYSCEPQNKVGTGPKEDLKLTVQGMEQSHLLRLIPALVLHV